MISFTSARLHTPLGIVIVIADDSALCFLDFVDEVGSNPRLEQFKKSVSASIVEGRTRIIALLEHELELYFKGLLKKFSVPLALRGTSFQKMAWNTLKDIPYGQTRSYKEQAITVGNEQAFRAVASANSLNCIVIVIPCHRIINSDGTLGGYRGGLERKTWLLKHEATYGKGRSMQKNLL